MSSNRQIKAAFAPTKWVDKMMWLALFYILLIFLYRHSLSDLLQSIRERRRVWKKLTPYVLQSNIQDRYLQKVTMGTLNAFDEKRKNINNTQSEPGNWLSTN